MWYNRGMVTKKIIPSKKRTIRLTRKPDADGIGTFEIRVGRRCENYVFKEIRCDIGGRGFAIHKLGLGTLYCSRTGEPSDTSCECLGFLKTNHCKHTEGLRALILQGLL